jgi:hypothetical protein
MRLAICPDIVIVDKLDGELMFNLILGIETLAKFSTVLDFQEHTIHIGHVVVATRPYTHLAQKTNMRIEVFQTGSMYVPPSSSTFARDHLEPIST